MAKKGNGEGSVHKLPNGRWRAQYYVETPKGRKRRSVSAASKQEARQLMMRGLYESQGIVEFDSATLTVGKYLRQWLESSAKSSVAPRTFANYELQVEQHLIPALGHVRLDKLTSLRIQTMYNAKLEAGLKPSTIRYIHAVLHRALRQAQMRWRLIGRNPADDVELPKVGQKKSNTLSMEQVDSFLTVAEESGDRFVALYHVAFFCGLRIGEILGLKWRYVDLDKREIHVRYQVQRMRDGSGLVEAQPKQDEQRTVPFGERVAAALKAHRLHQNEERLACGALYKDRDLVFATSRGTPFEASNVVNRSFKPLLKKAGLPDIPFHATRHTCATLMLAHDVDARTVQDILGHRDVATTLRFYGHVLPSMRRRAGAVFDEVKSTASPSEVGDAS